MTHEQKKINTMAVQASDLRIGNLFYSVNTANEVHIPTGLLFKVVEIAAFHIKAVLSDKSPAQIAEWGTFALTDISPIPLDADILEKAGFVVNEGHEHPAFDDFVHPDETRFGIGNFNGEYWLVDGLDQWGVSREYRYLHEIQNLWYALTGEELTIYL